LPDIGEGWQKKGGKVSAKKRSSKRRRPPRRGNTGGGRATCGKRGGKKWQPSKKSEEMRKFLSTEEKVFDAGWEKIKNVTGMTMGRFWREMTKGEVSSVLREGKTKPEASWGGVDKQRKRKKKIVGGAVGGGLGWRKRNWESKNKRRKKGNGQKGAGAVFPCGKNSSNEIISPEGSRNWNVCKAGGGGTLGEEINKPSPALFCGERGTGGEKYRARPGRVGKNKHGRGGGIYQKLKNHIWVGVGASGNKRTTLSMTKQMTTL